MLEPNSDFALDRNLISCSLYPYLAHSLRHITDKPLQGNLQGEAQDEGLSFRKYSGGWKETSKGTKKEASEKV